MHVAHTFEVVLQEKVAAVFGQGNINPVPAALSIAVQILNPALSASEGWGGVLLRLLISPAALRLGGWGGVPVAGGGVANA